jgi:hypothetical protein
MVTVTRQLQERISVYQTNEAALQFHDPGDLKPSEALRYALTPNANGISNRALGYLQCGGHGAVRA